MPFIKVLYPVLKSFVLVSSFLLLGLPYLAHGDGVSSQYWDNPNIVGSWSTSSWSAFPTGGRPLLPWSNAGNRAVFSASGLMASGSYSINLNAQVVVQDLVYPGSLSGNQLRITGTTNIMLIPGGQMTVTIDPGTIMVIFPAIGEVDPSGLALQSGTLVLAGTNTYSGVTTVTGGTLQIGNNGATGSIAGNVVDNAALDFSRGDNMTFFWSHFRHRKCLSN